MSEIKLNIGAGDTVIPGWTAIDRKFGTEAFPLDYADNSVDEIRASHILEHLSFGDASKAMEEWTRVLKPGGRIRVSVPDVDKVLKSDPKHRLFYLMGGQMHENDFHRSAYDEDRLSRLLAQNGLERIEHWHSPNTDTAALPISLNLEAYKPKEPHPAQMELKLGAYLTLPRYEAVVARSQIESALRPLGINLVTSQGVFWGQCMQRMFQSAVDKGLDWILSIDSDSLFTTQHISKLMDVFASNPHIDALAALQCRRGCPFPLMTTGRHEEGDVIETNGEPIKVATAHFGLTLIRVDALKQVQKPWFWAKPEENGDWEDGRMDDDIFFWHQWRLAGKNIYVTPSVSIGHLEETVAAFDKDMKPVHMYVRDWRKEVGLES